MKCISIVLLLAASCFLASAGESPYADKGLMDIMHWLKSIDGYSYDLDIRSVMKANPKQKMEQQSTIYTSNAAFIRYISGRVECSFLNKNGLFKVNQQSKTVTYKQFDSAGMAERVMAAAGVVDPGRLLDSVLLDKATISSKSKTGDVVEYKLSYQKDYMIRSLQLRFDLRKNLLLSVSYVVERFMNGVHRDEAILHQVVTMDGYRQGPPPALEAIIAGSNDLIQYLQTTYAGYNIQNL